MIRDYFNRLLSRTAPLSADVAKWPNTFKAKDTSRSRLVGCQPLASCSVRRFANYSSLILRLIARFGISISIISSSCTKPIAPPEAASGEA